MHAVLRRDQRPTCHAVQWVPLTLTGIWELARVPLNCQRRRDPQIRPVVVNIASCPRKRGQADNELALDRTRKCQPTLNQWFAPSFTQPLVRRAVEEARAMALRAKTVDLPTMAAVQDALARRVLAAAEKLPPGQK